MRTLDRYLLRSFFFNYLISLFTMISLYVVLDLFVNFDEFTESKKAVWAVAWDIADYYLFNVPLYFSQLSGVITLFAACFTLARLQRANEMTAVLASGTSLYRLAAPIVVAGFLMNVLLVANYELVLPRVAPKVARNRDDVEGTRVYDLWCIKDGNSRLISAQHFRPSEGRIRGLYIIELSTRPGDKGRLAGVVVADKAAWDPTARGWRLENGRHYDLSGDEVLEVAPTRLPDDFYPSDLAPEDLVLRKMAAWTQFLSTRQLNELVARGDTRVEVIAGIRHKRFTDPINNMILLLLGISFFLNRLPESVLNQGAKALATCAVTFLVAFAGQQLVGSAGLVIPGMNLQALPAWVPIFLFGPLAVLLLDNVKT
jgi:lipopolysaccharide export system permease protein